MSWYEFTFSDKSYHRFSRHLLFWLLWWFYFAATYYYYLQVGLQKISFGGLSAILVFKTFLLVLVHLVACYFFIYILLPRFLSTAKYVTLSTGIILLVVFLLVGGYLIHKLIFPDIDKVYNYHLPATSYTIWWTSINSVLLNAPKVIAAATAIKLVKRWYLKQKEKERIEKEKLITDLQLLKAQIRPGFLFGSLDQIYRYAQNKSPEAPELLLKFSDLLSYLLYECDEPGVPLEKELTMMKEYMLMEKTRYGKKLEMEIEIKGDPGNNVIAPLLLLSFIENSFKQCSQLTEQPWINLEINNELDVLTMKLMNGAIGTNTESPIVPNEIANVQKRLEMLYNGNYELKMYTEQEIAMVLLKINLNERFGWHQVTGTTTSHNYQFSKNAIQ